MKSKGLVILALFALFVLAGCSIFTSGSPAPLPTLVLGTPDAQPQTTSVPVRGGVTASGFVVLAQQAQLASVSGGNIQALNVGAGDAVKAGQVLVTLSGGEKLAAPVRSPVTLGPHLPQLPSRRVLRFDPDARDALGNLELAVQSFQSDRLLRRRSRRRRAHRHCQRYW